MYIKNVHIYVHIHGVFLPKVQFAPSTALASFKPKAIKICNFFKCMI
jgi:hypothetical protein